MHYIGHTYIAKQKFLITHKKQLSEVLTWQQKWGVTCGGGGDSSHSFSWDNSTSSQSMELEASESSSSG
jgi:hypothetical protein